MKPASRRIALVAAAFAAVAVCAVLPARGALRGGFRIDEAHKISETVFFRLLLEGRFDDPLWFGHIVDRTNPPAGKYLLGAGIAIQGFAIPSIPSLSHASVDGSIPAQHAEAQSAPYRPLLRAARRTALAATAIAAALVAWAAARALGLVAAAVATLLFVASFPVEGWGATAVFDPFLGAAFAATLALAGRLPRIERASAERGGAGGTPAPHGPLALLGTAAGIVAAIAFQIRFSGLAALGAFLLAAAFAYRHDLARLVACAAASVAAFTIAAVAMNPFYWAAASTDAIPASLRAGPLPSRIAGRMALQIRELASLFDLVASRNPTLRTPAGKLGFTAEIAFGDLAGLALLAGLLAFLGLAGWRVRSGPRAAGSLLIAAAALAVAYVAWLPLPWPRYVLPMMPPFALLAAAGWTWLAEAAARALATASARRGSEARSAR